MGTITRISKPIARFSMDFTLSLGLEDEKVQLGNGIGTTLNSLKDFDEEKIGLIQVSELEIKRVAIDQFGSSP